MITVKLDGGIGNQMFQYAAGKSLALELRTPLLLDINAFEDSGSRQYDLHIFPNITEGFCSKSQHNTLYSKSMGAKLHRLMGGLKVYREPHFHVDPDFFSLTAPVNLAGYFQSERYFLQHATAIRKQFTWDEHQLSSQTRAYLKQLGEKTAISVHFRRGDYITNQHTSEFHGTCGQSYYRNALAFMADKYPASHYCVFSDDLAWVKAENLFTHLDHTYIEKTSDMHDSEEIFLMSRCQHNIVANSSFSWWGAWLNNYHAKVVIAPQHWFKTATLDTKDLVPESWLRF